VRPALAIPRPGDPIILVVDASSTSVGACAMQRDTEGHEKPIAYLSRKLSPTQMKWSMIEKLLQLCVLQKWYAIVFGAHTVVYSDHNPRNFVTECAPKSSRLTR